MRDVTVLLGVLLLLGGTPVGAAAQAPDSAQEVIEHIHGVVVDAVDKKPVARALVASSDQRMATFTDTEGRFGFDVRRMVATPSAGGGAAATQTTVSIYLTVRRPGYLMQQMPVRLALGAPGASQPELRLKIVPEGLIRGRLSASDGIVPAGMVVQLHERRVQDGAGYWAPISSTQANSRGEFRFAGLQAGDYKIMSQEWTEPGPGGLAAGDESSGYPSAYCGDASDFTAAPPIHLSSGEAAEANLNLRASTFYRVSIPVSRMAQGGAVSVALGGEEMSSGYSLRFNPQTRMIEGFLPNGVYDVRISGFGQTPSSGSGRVEVAGRSVTAAAISLTPNGQIPVIVRQEYTANNTGDTGRASAPTLSPVGIESARHPTSPAATAASAPTLSPVAMEQARSLDISLRPVGMGGQGSNVRNRAGKGDQDLVLENVREGAYRVLATAYRGYVAAIASQGVDLLRQPLTVRPGGVSAPIEVTLRDDGATLTGSVTRDTTSGTPLDFDGETLFITCIPLGIDFGRAVQGMAWNGKFTIQNVPPGQYLILASRSAMQGIEYLNQDVLRQYRAKGLVVTLSASQKAEIQVPLSGEEEN